MQRGRIVDIIKVAVSLSLLTLLVRAVGWQETWAVVRRARLEFLGAAAVIYLFTLVVRAVRWRILLNAQGISVPTWRLAYLYFVGSFFNMVLPSGVGGDVVKIYELARHNPGDLSHFEARVVSSVIADRTSGLVVLFLMGAAVTPWAAGHLPPAVVSLLLGLTVVSMVGLAIFLNPTWRRRVERSVPGARWLFSRRGVRGLYASLEHYSWSALWRAASVSLGFNGLIVLVNVALGLAFRVSVPLIDYLVFVPIISFLLVLPFSINGLGVREGGYVALFGQVGVPRESALAMSLAFYAITLLAGLLGGLWYVVENVRSLRSSRNALRNRQEELSRHDVRAE